MTHVEEVGTLNTSNGFLTDIFTVFALAETVLLQEKVLEQKNVLVVVVVKWSACSPSSPTIRV